MNVDSLQFPVIALARGMVFPMRTFEDLTTCTKTALKNGFYSGQLLVDSTGRCVKVKGAKKLHGVGPFWGYNVFLNQRIRVELSFESQSSQLSVEDVREQVLNVQGRLGWDASEDFDEIGSHHTKRQEDRRYYKDDDRILLPKVFKLNVRRG